jgi:hypothetical protein
MTYVSRPVQHVRDDPDPGAETTLVLRVAEAADRDAVAARAREVGATVERELPFDALAVTVDEAKVGAVCELDGLEAVETANTLDVGAGDAGEDVEL